jgi:hypothetical protein
MAPTPGQAKNFPRVSPVNRPQIVKAGLPGRPPKGGFNRGVEIAAQREKLEPPAPPAALVLNTLEALVSARLSHAFFIYLHLGVCAHPDASKIVSQWSRTLLGKDRIADLDFCKSAISEFSSDLS